MLVEFRVGPESVEGPEQHRDTAAEPNERLFFSFKLTEFQILRGDH